MRWTTLIFSIFLMVLFSPISFCSTRVSLQEEMVSYPDLFSSSVFKYKDEGRRDPFVPLLKKEIEEEKKAELKTEKPTLRKVVIGSSKYSLIGLVWDEEGALAIIQAENRSWIVREGDMIDNFMISRIEGERGQVILIGEKQVVKLRISG